MFLQDHKGYELPAKLAGWCCRRMYDFLVLDHPQLPKGVRLQAVLEGIPEEELEGILPQLPGIHSCQRCCRLHPCMCEAASEAWPNGGKRHGCPSAHAWLALC